MITRFLHYLSKIADWQLKAHNFKVFQPENVFFNFNYGLSWLLIHFKKHFSSCADYLFMFQNYGLDKKDANFIIVALQKTALFSDESIKGYKDANFIIVALQKTALFSDESIKGYNSSRIIILFLLAD